MKRGPGPSIYKGDTIHFALVKLPPAVVYNGAGEPIALMDTFTRQRHPLREGEAIPDAKRRLGYTNPNDSDDFNRRVVTDDPALVVELPL